MPVSASVSFAVRYAEIDAQHVVYYAHHLAWFELGYEALFAAYGQPLPEQRPAVREAACRYRAPIRYGESVTVQSHSIGSEGGDLWVAHTLLVGDEVRATGATLLEGAGRLDSAPAAGQWERLAGWEALEPHGRQETFPLRVRYAESDPTRGAHYAHCLRWFEVGRIAYLHRIGLDYARMEADGSPFVIVWAGCRYLAPVHFDDLLEITVWIEEVRRRSFAVGYRLVHAADGRPAALGRSVQTFIGRTGRQVHAAAIPEWARAMLLEAAGCPEQKEDSPCAASYPLSRS